MDSMEEIYLKHGKMVYGFLLTRTQDPDLAEELTQETFYRAVKNIGKYKGKSSVSTWLCGIAKNLWYEHARSRKNHVTPPRRSRGLRSWSRRLNGSFIVENLSLTTRSI